MDKRATHKVGFDNMINPGDFILTSSKSGKNTGIMFLCPCGCGGFVSVVFVSGNRPTWDWDGDEDLPTVIPSIRRVGGCGWHGYLTKGIFKSC